jgi:uncharacterized protein YbaR (Trm112 family)
MRNYLIEMLECPACHGELAWTVAERCGNRIEMAEARCTACAATYPVREGIGLFLTPELPRDDLWEEADSRLIQYLREHPQVERPLMGVPLDTLAPADQSFRALVLEERGEYAEAKAAEDLANVGLYTPEVLVCQESQVNYVLERLSASDGPIVDLASGRGYLVEELARKLERPIIATDFSPRVLRRDRRWLEFLGLDPYDQVSLLAFDARRTPFKDGAVETLTTNLGLPNIREPGNLLQELRRIIAGTFLAVHHFYPEDDEANAAALHEVGLSTLLFHRSALECFAEAGWQVEVANVCAGKARPTPTGVVLEGAGIDAFPVVETVLEWCVLVAR